MKNVGVMTLDEVIRVMLEPYFSSVRYLRMANFNYPSIEGYFEINNSCYCEETGHFTLTELSICYNQLAYTFFGYSAQEGLVGDYGKVPIEIFRGLRHRNMLIPKVREITFKKQINPKKFYGSINFGKAREFKGSGFFDTSFRFWDKNGGNASGEILLAKV